MDELLKSIPFGNDAKSGASSTEDLSEIEGVILPVAFVEALASGNARQSASAFRQKLTTTVRSNEFTTEHIASELAKAVVYAERRAKSGNASNADLFSSGLSFLSNIRAPRSRAGLDDGAYNEEPSLTGYLPGGVVAHLEFVSVAGGSPKTVLRYVTEEDIGKITNGIGDPPGKIAGIASDVLATWARKQHGGGIQWRERLLADCRAKFLSHTKYANQGESA